MEKTEKWSTQGSVQALLLFNVYTYDLPELKPMKQFLFADDLVILAQDDTWEDGSQARNSFEI